MGPCDRRRTRFVPWHSRHIAAEPVRIRVEPLTVPPATQPLVSVVVRNLQDRPCPARSRSQVPATGESLRTASRWNWPAAAEKRFAFNIEKARNVEANVYPFTVNASVGDQLVRCEQSVFVASAPYSKATVDGRADEWQDAIPVSFEQQGKRTTISTFWHRKRFYLLVAVQEQQHLDYTGADGPPGDAVQLAISRRNRPMPPARRLPDGLNSCSRRRVAPPSVFNWPPGTHRENWRVKHEVWSPWCAATPRRQSCGTAR